FEPDLIQLPTAELDWAGSPRFELGYRLAECFGAFSVAYRFFSTEGEAALPNFDLDGGLLRSRLDVNVVDLDYSSRELSLGPNWDMQWRVGVRFGDVFFDSHAESLFFEQRASNNFFGAGPHVGLHLGRPLGLPGM